MQSVLRLRTEDFHIDAGSKGPLLCTNIKGLALILFWSPNCPICHKLWPEFQRLPQFINTVRFGALNINENQQIIPMAKSSIAPIEAVPYIVFYVNNRPFLQFDDQATIEKIIGFVQYTLRLVDNKKSFIDKGAKVSSDIPPYSIAKGYHDFKCDDNGFCYLTYNQAYGKNTAMTQMQPEGHVDNGQRT